MKQQKKHHYSYIMRVKKIVVYFYSLSLSEVDILPKKAYMIFHMILIWLIADAEMGIMALADLFLRPCLGHARNITGSFD